MSENDINELLKINDILQSSEAADSMWEENKEKYLKVLQRLNASNKHNHIASMAKASQTYIHQSTMGTNYYESLSPEMRLLTDSVYSAFDEDSEISSKYNRQIFRQIIVSSYEIDYAEHSPLQTADISNVNDAYTIKPSNFTFNLKNFLKYLSEIQLLGKEIEKRDIIAVLTVALGTIAQLKSDLTKKIDVECARFLRFMYTEIGFCREEDVDTIIEKYLKCNEGSASGLDSNGVNDKINDLVALKVAEIVSGNVRIIEKIHI